MRARLKLKDQLRERLVEVKRLLAELVPLQEEKEEIERLLATYEPKETGPSCGPSCAGCDICRRGWEYR